MTKRSGLHTATLAIASFFILPMAVWAVGALYFDFPHPKLRLPLIAIYVLAIVAAWILSRRYSGALLVALVGFLVILVWWRTLRPEQYANWQPDNEKTSWATVEGDRVTIHDFRQCDYRTELD